MNEPDHYSIQIKGFLNTDWENHFDGLTITRTDDGNSCLHGPISDQAALHGVFKKMHNLGITIISVNPTNQGE